VDNFIVYGSLSSVRLAPGFVERSQAYDVGPGDGVFFPSTSPHMTRTDSAWARPGDGVSISIGVNFYTTAIRRKAYAHAFNLALRKLGVAPRHPGESAFVDALKQPPGHALIWALKTFRGYKPKPSF
jgi:hypothetical protein